MGNIPIANDQSIQRAFHPLKNIIKTTREKVIVSGIGMTKAATNSPPSLEIIPCEIEVHPIDQLNSN